MRGARSTKGYVWTFRDGWAFCKGDADNGVTALAQQFKREYPKGRVRSFKRSIRAGGGTIPCTVVVVQLKEAQCTCGHAYERGYKLPNQLCAYCVHGKDHLDREGA